MRPGKLRNTLDYVNAAGYIVLMLGAAFIIGPLFAIGILVATGVMPSHQREDELRNDEVEAWEEKRRREADD
jgi:hypothetical protein